MTELGATIAAVLIALGSLLMLLAAIGVLRMPDLYTRMSAATKGASLGAGLVLLAVAVHFGQWAVATQAVVVIFFIFLTVPVAAHMVGRAGYLSGVPISERTRFNELQDQYDPNTFDLKNREDERP